MQGGKGKRGEKRQRNVGEEILRFNMGAMGCIHTIDRKKRNMNEAPKHIFLCSCLRSLKQVAWGQSSAQELLAASEAGLISYEMWSEEWWSDAWGDGCSDCAIFSWLLLPLIVAQFACLRACVYVRPFFFFTLLCNAVSDLGKNMCQRDIGRELSECVTTSTSVSSLTAQLATSLQSSSHKQLEHYQFSFFSSMHTYTAGCKAGVRLDGRNRWPFYLKKKKKIIIKL